MDRQVVEDRPSRRRASARSRRRRRRRVVERQEERRTPSADHDDPASHGRAAIRARAAARGAARDEKDREPTSKAYVGKSHVLSGQSAPTAEREQHEASESTAAGPFGRAARRRARARGHDRERQCHRVRVEVGVEVREGRKLGDRPRLTVGMPDHAGRVPVPPLDRNRPVEAVGEDSQLAEVPEDCDERARRAARSPPVGDGARACAGRPLPSATRRREAAAPRRARKRRDREVVGDAGAMPSLHQHARRGRSRSSSSSSSAGEPRVVGRELRRLRRPRSGRRNPSASRRRASDARGRGSTSARAGWQSNSAQKTASSTREQPPAVAQPGDELAGGRRDREPRPPATNERRCDRDGVSREREQPQAREPPHDPA